MTKQNYICTYWNQATDEEIYVHMEGESWFQVEPAFNKLKRMPGWMRGQHFWVPADSEYLKSARPISLFTEDL